MKGKSCNPATFHHLRKRQKSGRNNGDGSMYIRHPLELCFCVRARTWSTHFSFLQLSGSRHSNEAAKSISNRMLIDIKLVFFFLFFFFFLSSLSVCLSIFLVPEDVILSSPLRNLQRHVLKSPIFAQFRLGRSKIVQISVKKVNNCQHFHSIRRKRSKILFRSSTFLFKGQKM